MRYVNCGKEDSKEEENIQRKREIKEEAKCEHPTFNIQHSTFNIQRKRERGERNAKFAQLPLPEGSGSMRYDKKYYCAGGILTSDGV